MSGRAAKGQIGCLKAGRKREWIRTLLLFCISAALLFTGMIITKRMHPDYSWGESRNNLLTVAAVLGVLPAARALILAIMYTRSASYGCPPELAALLKDFEKTRCLAYDLYLTAEQKNFPLPAVLCTDNEIAGLLIGDAALAAEGEAHIREALVKAGKTHVRVKLFWEASSFIKRVEHASCGGEAAVELLGLLCQLSL